jgi:hypothetical protein
VAVEPDGMALKTVAVLAGASIFGSAGFLLSVD